MNESYGSENEPLNVSDDVIAVCAVNAALRIPSVAGFSGDFTDNLSNMFGKTPLYKGVKVAQDDSGIAIDLNIIVKYGINIHAMAWDIQKSVKQEVESMVEKKVTAVNVHVQGVQPAEDGESRDGF